MVDRSNFAVRWVARGCTAALVMCVALSAGLACGGSSGSGGSSTSSTSSGTGSSPTTGTQASTVNQDHWDTALAALSSPYQRPSNEFSDPALRGWSELLRRAWPAFQLVIGPPLEQAIRTQLTGLTASNGAVVTSIRTLTLDIGAAPGLSSPDPSSVSLDVPAAPGAWGVTATLDVQVPIQTQVLGIPISTVIAGDLTAEIRNLRFVSDVVFDLTDPANPKPVGAVSPRVTFQLVLSSNTPLIQGLTGTLTQVLDPVIRAGLAVGGIYIQQQLTGMLQGVGGQTWGLGGPGIQPVQNPVNLEALALQVSDEIVATHTPFGTVVDAVFDQPTYGSGNVVRYGGYGDSAIWTGHYLMAEALRFDVTGDPRARAAAEKVFEGLRKSIDVSAYDGQLSRCVIPVSSPQITSIQNGLDYSVGLVDGIAYGCEGNISRDQYLGCVMGMVQSFLRVPSLRDRARVLINRMIDYLNRNEWIAYQHDGVTPARGLFAQTPHVVWAMIKAANLVDPNRWGGLHAQYRGLSEIGWFTAWASNFEVHSSYYKFNLGHATAVIQASCETDPTLYRDYVRTLETTRDAVGHHMNGWFDSVYAFLVPARAQIFGPVVESELQHWALRSRRRQPVDLTNDPAIIAVPYTSSLLSTNSVAGATSGAQTIQVALHPIPIEKRGYTDFVWQRGPFGLTGHGNPTHQTPGVDLVLPYWLGRSYGFLP
ncbi:MAG: hypothetical protein ACYS22_11525 [Planctomycetota bacterium]|jgi:hypothetical protein